MGRESEAREAAERERARVAFSQSPQLYDRFGHPLMMGCELEFHDELPPVYQIIDIKPDLRKEVPPNAYLVTMRADLIVTVVSRYPINKATLVRMPAIGAADMTTGGGDAAGGNQASDQASDAEAPPQGAIVLTDMDRTARQTLSEVLPPPAAPLALVPPPAPPAELPDSPPPPAPDEEIVF